jgi:hypothetical protein
MSSIEVDLAGHFSVVAWAAPTVRRTAKAARQDLKSITRSLIEFILVKRRPKRVQRHPLNSGFLLDVLAWGRPQPAAFCRKI